MWFNNHKTLIAGLAALTLGAHGVVAAGPLKTGDQFSDLAQFSLEGKLPETLKGKVVIVDFWASWCGPCRASFPVLEQLHKDYAAKGPVIIAVNVDDKAVTKDAFLRKTPVSFTVVRDAVKKLVVTANVASMPTSFVLTGDGRVHAIHNGFQGEATRKQYIQEIEQLLKKS
jgi:thiol-disulfide isomerase/thioredoxin